MDRHANKLLRRRQSLPTGNRPSGLKDLVTCPVEFAKGLRPPRRRHATFVELSDGEVELNRWTDLSKAQECRIVRSDTKGLVEPPHATQNLGARNSPLMCGEVTPTESVLLFPFEVPWWCHDS